MTNCMSDADERDLLFYQNSQLKAEIERLERGLRAALDEIERWRSLGEAILGNDPDDAAADAVTALDVWRKEAETLLGLSPDQTKEKP